MGRMKAVSTYVKEMFAISQAMGKWRHYLLSEIIQTPKQQAFLYKLLGFNYTIECKLGKEKNVVVALSRVIEEEVETGSKEGHYPISISMYSRHTNRTQER